MRDKIKNIVDSAREEVILRLIRTIQVLAEDGVVLKLYTTSKTYTPDGEEQNYAIDSMFPAMIMKEKGDFSAVVDTITDNAITYVKPHTLRILKGNENVRLYGIKEDKAIDSSEMYLEDLMYLESKIRERIGRVCEANNKNYGTLNIDIFKHLEGGSNAETDDNA